MSDKSERPAKQLTAETVAPGMQSAAIDVGGFRVEQGSALYGALVIVLAILGLRLKLSRDNKEIHKNRADSGTYTALEQQRDHAIAREKAANESERAAWQQRTLDAARIASLEAQNKHLTEQIQELREELHQVEGELRDLKRKWKESGFGSLPRQ